MKFLLGSYLLSFVLVFGYWLFIWWSLRSLKRRQQTLHTEQP